MKCTVVQHRTVPQLYKITPLVSFFLSLAQQPNAGLGRLIFEASRSYTMTQQSVGLLWTGDEPVAETST